MDATIAGMDTATALRRLAETRDPEAWGALLEQHGPAIQGVCRRVLRDAALAEDACQETLLQIRELAGKFSPKGPDPEVSARAWVLQIACHTALHVLRKNRRDQRRDSEHSADREGSERSTSEAHAMNREAAEALHRELANLPEAERTPIVLHYFGELGYEDLAATLGCPVGTAKARVSRGVNRLRERLALLGMILAAGECAAALRGSEAQAAEAAGSVGSNALTAQQLSQWKALLNSPRTPAVPTMAANTGVSTMIKLGVGMAALLLAALLAFTMLRSNSQDQASPPVAQPAGGPATGTTAGKTGEPAKPATADEIKKIVQGNNAFAFGLYGKLRAEKGNLFFSPFSVGAAMTQVMAGARGNTAVEMSQVLCAPVGKGLEHMQAFVTQDAVQPAFGALLRALDGAGKKRSYQLSIANSLWMQEDLPFEPDFVACLKENYDSGLQAVDFKKDPETARLRINAWVEEKTRKKITDILGPDSIKKDSKLAVANAIYFKSAWQHRFSKGMTENADFTLMDGTKVQVPMMRETESYRFAHCETKRRHMVSDGFDALELPYEGRELSMLVLVPFGDLGAEALTNDLEAAVASGNLDEVLKGMKSEQVSVFVPRFKMTWSADLKDTLIAMGMKETFTPSKADFSGMTKRAELSIGLVAHKAFVEVNEESTEAAAATVAIAEDKGPMVKPREFHADRPFVFLIRENATGTILFMGRVADPREQQ